jgi:hypothetical protein
MSVKLAAMTAVRHAAGVKRRVSDVALKTTAIATGHRRLPGLGGWLTAAG